MIIYTNLTRYEIPYLKGERVENEILKFSDMKMYEELNETRCSSIGVKFTESWLLNVEKCGKLIFEKKAFKIFHLFFFPISTIRYASVKMKLQ